MAPSEPKKEKKERTLTGLHVRKNLRRMASGGSSRKDEEAANEDLHTGAWDPQLDDIEDVPWRNYVEGEPLPPDR